MDSLNLILSVVMLIPLPKQEAPLVPMLREVVTEIEKREGELKKIVIDRNVGFRMNGQVEVGVNWGDIAGALTLESQHVSEMMSCPSHAAAFSDCTIPDNLIVVRARRLDVSPGTAELDFDLIQASGKEGRVHNLGLEARFSRGEGEAGEWSLDNVAVRRIP